MRIILTHEQADFDALGSLLGASLLDEAALPVLPRRMNRNVRAFVNLYGVEFPFVDQGDLTGERIEQVILVDTQSMISVKGMQTDTRVEVFDHHPRREDLPAGWEFTVEDTGATSTLFGEALRERDYSLTPLQATLLLLGIYEDTGSLTYTRTTPRDLNAAAFLLEHGASLQIAADFLNHPLSAQQQTLYDRLRASLQTHHINGHTVVIACGDAQDVGEEISSVAHKLRDLLDPDALFVLVTVRGGVQLIARSTSDQIDVGEISAVFAGGGHERAAAALIKDGNVAATCDELLRILPSHIHPAVTVAQIMSSGAQLLAPETPVEEAARRMQRYGYEGYPVVKDDQIVGLLTRRAVDRALAHQKNFTGIKYTAGSLMEAGRFSVNPDDSIEQLQRLMTDSGWGQIPVISPESRQVIGIVTRTDLLKTLARPGRFPSHPNLADRLEAILPPARLALLRVVASAAHAEHAALYIVGGFVRDLLLERPSQDFDLVVEGDAVELARSLARRYGGRVTSHARFGTAKWHIAAIREELAVKLKENLQEDEDSRSDPSDAHPSMQKNEAETTTLSPADLPQALDLVSARTEFYAHPTALPTVERGSIKLDLHRRDFTINTLALRLDGRHYGELHDYWGGLNDLRHGLVRILHSLSFVDDPTRLLRAVRFEQRFDFAIETRTLELLTDARPLLDRISGDRIRHELNHILSETHAAAMLARLEELKLLFAIQKDLKWDDWLHRHIGNLREATLEAYWDLDERQSPVEKGAPLIQSLAYILWLLRLPATRIKSVIARLRIPRALAEEIYTARGLWVDLDSLADLAPSRIALRLEVVSPLALYAVYLATSDEHLRSILIAYASRWRDMSPATSGHTLRAMGLPPGPAYKEILSRLRAGWIDGEITSAKDEQILLEKLVYEASQING